VSLPLAVLGMAARASSGRVRSTCSACRLAARYADVYPSELSAGSASV